MPSFTQTVRFKLTVWYSSLLLVFGVAFVVALNLAARLDRPSGLSHYEVIETGRQLPGGAILVRPSPTAEDLESQLYDENMGNLRTWSLAAVVGLAIASGIGGYVLSGMLLQPVRRITRVAAEITASNLSQRINHTGPDDEIKALADTLDSMIGRLEHSFEQQREFVQNASHELRTPLAAIRTNIEVTEMDPEVSPEEYRTLLETVKTQTERLTRLSEDLLTLSTAEREHQEIEPVSLSRLGREVVANLTSTAAARGTSLVLEGDDQLMAEANGDSLYRAVFNLVENAIKYSGDGSTVTVLSRRSGAFAEIAVADDGVGIPPETLPQIFDRFYRVDKGRSRREGGTGLGLAIVKELIQGMGGAVSVTSSPGAGTTFTVRLPASTEDAPASLNVRSLNATPVSSARV
jgi:signal transduction histidine kinase